MHTEPRLQSSRIDGRQTVPDDEDVIAYARMAEHLFKLPVFYMEYSGMYGDPEIVELAARTLENTQLFYGGGIRNADEAKDDGSHRGYSCCWQYHL